MDDFGRFVDATKNPPPVKLETFYAAIQLGTAAMAFRVPQGAIPSTAGSSVRIAGLNPAKPEAETIVTFTNSPELRMVDAIVDVVGGSREDALPCIARVWELQGLLHDHECDQWMRKAEDGEEMEILEAVLRVAATAPMHEGRFDRADFKKRVEAAIAEDDALEKHT